MRGPYSFGEAMALSQRSIQSPVGRLKMVAGTRGLVAVFWEHDRPGRVPLENAVYEPDHPVLVSIAAQLREYFAGDRQQFSVPLDLRGTQFQVSVWEALLSIPFGETRSYGELARQLGNSAATRAVGAANGRNPISIIVPCHRVVGSTGKLTGFAGGLEAKAILLQLEGRTRRLFP